MKRPVHFAVFGLLGVVLLLSCQSSAADNAIEAIYPSQNRVVGMLEWVQADLGEAVDPAKCELILVGPDGKVPGKLSVNGRRLKFVPDGAGRIEMGAPAVTRADGGMVVKFVGTSIGAGVIQGPDGNAWQWRVDDSGPTGRFDLYLPSKRVGYRRYSEHTQTIVGGLEPGEHRLTITPTKADSASLTPPGAYWIHSRMPWFVTSTLRPGAYTATVVAKTSDGAESGRKVQRFYVDPVLTRDVTAHIETGHFGNVVLHGDDPQLRVVISNATTAPLELTASVEVMDFRGETKLIEGPTTSVLPDDSQTQSLLWPNPGVGWYLCTLRVTTPNDGKVVVATPVTVAILPAAPDRIVGAAPLEGVFDRGLNGALEEDPEKPLQFSYHAPDNHLSLYRKAGIQYIHGPISRTPEFLARTRKYGLEVGVADLGLGIREFDSPELAKAMSGFEARAATEIKRFAPATSYQYGGDEANTFRSTSYQVWAAAQKVNYLALKRLDPNSQISTGQVGAWHDLDFFLGMAEQGAWPYIDFLNIHLYFPPEKLRHSLDLYAWMFRQVGVKPVTLGLWARSGKTPANPESPFPFNDRYLAQLRAQAVAGFKQRVILRRYPWVNKYWHWNAYDYFECPDHSILFWDKTPKPLLAAIAALTWKLNGAAYVGPLDTGDSRISADVFDRRGQAVVAVWSESPRELVVDEVKGKVQVTDIMGRTSTVEADGELKLSVTPEPILVEVPGHTLLDQARSDADQLRQAEQYWRRRAIVFKAGAGRGTRSEAILAAGDTLPLDIRIINAGDRTLRGRMAMARETRQGDWYGPTVSVLDGFQPFELEPKEQASLVFRVSAKEDAGTSDLTLRTLGYVQSDSRQVFLDPTTINIIVERKQGQK